MAVILIDPGQELSMRPMANSRRFNTDISQGKNGMMSAGVWPPFSSQLLKNQVNQVRTLIFDRVNLASSEKSIAAKRPLHNAPEP